MKFFFLYILPAFVLSTLASAQYISPTAGETISSTDPFNLTWVSGKYFKETSLNITVLFARSPFSSSLNGVVLVEGLVSNDPGIKTYSAELAPRYFYNDNETGAFDIIIIETYQAYGGANIATELYIQTVNLAGP
ncbi:uncharacterized protein BT62DRAFT_249311 [Guyanagaster necrorhizus]|uniref:Uncharacterized protein n=1 Tax=Guyanagaster necrorhizus TaxID=856835 RepID=A0A9P8ARP1_9AGAR|nr:uncharacterized protein BT62DRAFT_249311 [Guyanagaster necrorhizus MCA 3950]KAG7444052.1 hypothetical protein BT62DRAFT_249311 [Guyanagaster necrorhizus MCA 3950]